MSVTDPLYPEKDPTKESYEEPALRRESEGAGVSARTILLIVYTVIGLGLFFVSAATSGLFQAEGRAVFHILSDSFLLPAVLLGGFGALGYVASQGFFDLFRYAGHIIWSGFRHPKERFSSYYDYKNHLASERKTWLPDMLLVGLVFFALSVVCYIIYGGMA